jgi:hypothetical protein
VELEKLVEWFHSLDGLYDLGNPWKDRAPFPRIRIQVERIELNPHDLHLIDMFSRYEEE